MPGTKETAAAGDHMPVEVATYASKMAGHAVSNSSAVVSNALAHDMCGLGFLAHRPNMLIAQQHDRTNHQRAHTNAAAASCPAPVHVRMHVRTTQQHAHTNAASASCPAPALRVGEKSQTDLSLLLDALSPRDHSQEILRNALSELGLKHGNATSEQLHQAARSNILLQDLETFPYAVRCFDRSASIPRASASLSSIGSSSSFASSVGSSSSFCEKTQDMLASTVRTVARKKAVPGDKKSKDCLKGRDSKDLCIIHPRRKVGQAHRNTDHVVISVEMLENHFDKSLNDAAGQLGICATAIKKACRRFGITRWPFRDRPRQPVPAAHPSAAASSASTALSATTTAAQKGDGDVEGVGKIGCKQLEDIVNDDKPATLASNSLDHASNVTLTRAPLQPTPPKHQHTTALSGLMKGYAGALPDVVMAGAQGEDTPGGPCEV
jgi:hypothetical protein